MKKLIIVFLILALIHPVMSFADFNEYDFNGVWTCYIYEKEPETDSYLHMYQFVFDGSYCVHFVYDYYSNSSGYILSEYETGRHYYTIDGSVLTFKEYQTSDDIQFTGRWSGGYLYISFDGEIWRRFTRSEYQYYDGDVFTADTVPDAFPASVYAALDEGYDIPAGIYVIGKDIPAGDYEIHSSALVHFTVKASQTTRSSPTIFDVPAGGTFGKITLEAGNVFAFTPSSITLKTYKGLFN